jgi:hypothetical protein
MIKRALRSFNKNFSCLRWLCSTDSLFSAANREFLGYAVVNDQPYDNHYLDPPTLPMLNIHKTATGSTINAMYSARSATGAAQAFASTTTRDLESLTKVMDMRTMLGRVLVCG